MNVNLNLTPVERVIDPQQEPTAIKVANFVAWIVGVFGGLGAAIAPFLFFAALGQRFAAMNAATAAWLFGASLSAIGFATLLMNVGGIRLHLMELVALQARRDGLKAVVEGDDGDSTQVGEPSQ